MNLYGFIWNNPMGDIDLLGLAITSEKYRWRSPYLYQNTGSGIDMNWGKYHSLYNVQYDDSTGKIISVGHLMDQWHYWWHIDSDVDKSGLEWRVLRKEPVYSVGRKQASFEQSLYVAGEDFDKFALKYAQKVGKKLLQLPWVAGTAYDQVANRVTAWLDTMHKPTASISTSFELTTYCHEDDDGSITYKLWVRDPVNNDIKNSSQMWFQDNLSSHDMMMYKMTDNSLRRYLKNQAGWSAGKIDRAIKERDIWRMY